jgi:hypothetical protein
MPNTYKRNKTQEDLQDAGETFLEKSWSLQAARW